MAQNIRDIRNIIYNSLEQETLGRALAQLGLIAKGEHQEQLSNIRESYNLMLQYLFMDMDDPEREDIFAHLIKECYELTDNVCATYMSQETPVNEIFTYLWTPIRFEQEHIDYCQKFLSSDNFVDCCMAVSAVTISCLRIFDEKKFHILVKFCDCKQKEASLRALTGILLCLIRHHKRISHYPSITNTLSLLLDNEQRVNYARAIILQFIRCKETNKISKDINENIIPTLSKIAPDIKNNADNIDFDNDDFEENLYNLQDLLNENGLGDKMKTYSELQLQGSDINYSTFSKVKFFSFFDKIDNWFMPFDPQNRYVCELYDNQDPSNNILVNLLDNKFICDNDKYSLCLNILSLPIDYRKSMASQIKLENEQIEEINNSLDSDICYLNRYMQDLYRFYTLYKNKNDFNNIFEYAPDIHKMPFFRFLNQENEFLSLYADYLLSKEQYNSAESAYIQLINIERNNSEIYYKIGICELKLKNYIKAIEYLQKAEIIDTDNIAIIKKLAHCYRKIGEFDNALRYYKILLNNTPDDLNILFNIGLCNCGLGKFDSAIKYFEKIDYLNNDAKRTPNFQLYFGHCLWTANRKKEAIARYRLYEPIKELDIELHKAPLNLSERDIIYITDYIRYNN